MNFFRCIRRDGTEEHEEEVKEKEKEEARKEDSKDEPVHIDIMSDDDDEDEEQKNDSASSSVPPKDQRFCEASMKNLRAEINAYENIDQLQEIFHENHERVEEKRCKAPLDFFMKKDGHRSFSPPPTHEIRIEANRTKFCGEMMGKSQITFRETHMKVTLWSLENEKRCWEDTINYDHLVNLCLYQCPTGPPHLLILEMTRVASLATYYDSVCARLTQKYGSPPKCLYGAIFYFNDDFDFVKCRSAGAFSAPLQHFFDTEMSEHEANLLLAEEFRDTANASSTTNNTEKEQAIDRRRSLRLVDKKSTQDEDWKKLASHYDQESDFIGDASSGRASKRRRRTSRISEEEKSKLLLTYPFEAKGPGRISITLGDIDRLPPGEFLNDTIIDFYYKFLWRHLERWQQTQFYFFSTHFFTALQGSKETATTTTTDPTSSIQQQQQQQQQELQEEEEQPPPQRFSRVLRWTQKIDLFGKKFLFVPINDSFHWSLAVICNPGSAIVIPKKKKKKLVDLSSEVADHPKEEEEEEPEEEIPQQNPPCILFLDSLKCHRKRKFSNLLKEYLASEWKSRTKKDPNATNHRYFDTEKFTLIEPMIPLQTNSWDCGVFILMYGFEIIRRMPMGLTIDQMSTKLTCTLSKEMFNQEHVQEFRDYLLQLLYTLQSLQEKQLSEKQIKKEQLQHFQIEL